MVFARGGRHVFCPGEDGRIDISFGPSRLNPGRVMTDFRRLPNEGRSDDMAFAMAIQEDGKIVAAGETTSPNRDLNFALVRYNNAPPPSEQEDAQEDDLE
jgi:hypothetical protein